MNSADGRGGPGFRLGLLIGVLGAAVIALGVGLVVALSGGDEETGNAEKSTPDATTTAPDLEIVADDKGVQSLGDFKPQIQGLTGAIDTYGEPTDLQRDGDACFAGWVPLTLVIIFANLGGEDPCAPESGRVASIAIGNTGAESGRWVTAEGLRLGDSLARLNELYPGAHRVSAFEAPGQGLLAGQSGYSLVDGTSIIGEGGSIVILAATVTAGEVDGFLMHVGAAGE